MADSFFVAPASVRLSADATAGSSPVARVEFYSGTALVGTANASPYNVNWTGVSPGTYTITAKAIDSAARATTSAPVTISVGALAIAISSPANGASIAGNEVLVNGTIQASPNSGVTVNGHVAALDAQGRFYLRIPLAAGANEVQATVTTPSGQALSQAINITSDGVSPAVRIRASPVSGIHPLTVTVDIGNGGSSAVTVQVNGTPSGTVPPGQSASLDVVFNGEGTFPLSVTATDALSNVTTGSFMVVTVDEAKLDQLMRAVWGGMTDALAGGDKSMALSYLNESARAKYGPVFDALMPYLPQIVASYSPLGKSALSTESAEYAIARTYNGGKRLYFIYFVLGADGVWRIDAI